MISKLSSKQLEEIIKIVKTTSVKQYQYWTEDYLNEYIKKEVAEYLQLPDLFNCK